MTEDRSLLQHAMVASLSLVTLWGQQSTTVTPVTPGVSASFTVSHGMPPASYDPALGTTFTAIELPRGYFAERMSEDLGVLLSKAIPEAGGIRNEYFWWSAGDSAKLLQIPQYSSVAGWLMNSKGRLPVVTETDVERLSILDAPTGVLSQIAAFPDDSSPILAATSDTYIAVTVITDFRLPEPEYDPDGTAPPLPAEQTIYRLRWDSGVKSPMYIEPYADNAPRDILSINNAGATISYVYGGGDGGVTEGLYVGGQRLTGEDEVWWSAVLNDNDVAGLMGAGLAVWDRGEMYPFGDETGLIADITNGNILLVNEDDGDVSIWRYRHEPGGVVTFDEFDMSQVVPNLKVTFGVQMLDSGAMLVDGERDGQLGSYVLVPVALHADSNRDGVLDGVDSTTVAEPFGFWLNDDDDDGDVNGSDIPGDGSNDFGTGIAGPPGLGSDFGVDGNRDLIDWFPVFLDLKQLLTVLPPSASVKYKLKHEGNALSFVYTDFTRERAFAYQKERLVTGFGFNFDRAPGEAQATQITATGAVLSDEFLTRVKDQNAGVILVEAGAATDKPLVLVVEKDGTAIAEVKLELKIGPVEDMYRRLNLRAGSDAPSSGLSGLRQDDGLPTSMGEPSNFPDATGADSWLIFVHGYNVGGAAARGWNSEAFKRFYWSHNKARFVGVSWFGNPYGAEDDKVADYHLAVMNAFVSAPALAAKINPLTGRKTIVGHSLGCGIVSSAIHDAGLVVNDFCMVDAAMSMEAYKSDTTADVEGMALPPWVDGEASSTPNYPRGAWASEWHRLFENTPTDQRNGVTWRGRLSGVVSVAHNFYSRTEDVLARLPGAPPDGILSILWSQPGMLNGRYAWTVQEKTKGRRMDINVLVGHVRAGSDYGGWGFNLTDPADPTDPVYYWADGSAFGGCKRAPLSSFPDPATSFGRELCKRAPLFDPGYGPETGCSRWYDPTQNLRGPDWLPNLFNDATGSATAADPAKRNQLLAQAFPALTQPAGANYTSAFSAARNHNMPEELLSPAGWPSARGQEVVGGTPMARWLHSDMREVAYLYTHLLFDQIVTISGGTP